MSNESTGTIAEMGLGGDTKFSWDRNNPKDCKAAREVFETMKKKGYIIFRTKWYGLKVDKAMPQEHFDSSAGTYVFQEPGSVTIAKEFDARADYVATPPVGGG